MAKQVNVPINYRVNTIEVDQAKTRVEQAQRATDNLRTATQQFTSTASQGFKAASRTVEGMEIELARLRQQIKLTDTTDKQRYTTLMAQYKNLQSQVQAYNKELSNTQKVAKQTAQSHRELGNNMRDVYTAAKLLITAGVARELVNISLEASKLAGNIEGVSTAFRNQVPAAESVLNRLRDATKGTVTDLELMQKALLAKNFGISLEALPRLLEFAAVRAQQTGQSVDYLVNSIVNGIGRKSLLILDNLQLSATDIRKELHGVSTQAATVGQVSEALGRIAERELGKMGGYAETAATKVDQLAVSTHELRVEVAKWAEDGPSGGVSGFLKDYADSFKALFEAMNRGISVSEVFEERQTKEIAQISANEWMTRRLTGSKEENIKAIEEEIAAITKELGEYAKTRDENQKTIKQLNEEILARKGNAYVLEDNIELLKKGLEPKTKDAKIDQEILKLLQERLLAMKQLNKTTTESPGLIEQTKDQIEELGKALDKAKTAEEIGNINFQLAVLEQRLKRLQGINKSDIKIDAFKVSDKSNKETISQQNKEYAKVLGADLQKQLNEVLSNLVLVLPEPQPSGLTPALTDWQQMWEDNKVAAAEASIDITESFIQAEMKRELDVYNQRIQNTRDFYDAQIALAGDNERAKQMLRIQEQRELDKINRAKAEKEKRLAQASILVNTAAAIAKVFNQYGWPQGIIPAAIVAAQGAVQYANASRARYYAKGEVDIKGGTPGKDSIPAMIMPGESVITTDKTRKSKQTLKMIHAGKLNDSVMRDILSGKSGGATANVFDDSKIVKELRSIKEATPDVVKRANLVYEVRKRGDNYKQYIRSKSMGY
jgi:hypothetical protein